MWTSCGSYAACVQCAGAQAILNDPLQAHTSAACILGDELLIAALQHYVRGDIRKTETGEPAARKAGDQARPEETHTTKRDSRSPARDGSRAQRKRRASRSPDRRPRHRGSRSRSDRRGRPRDRSRTPRRRSRSRNRRSRSRNRSPSPRREHRSKAGLSPGEQEVNMPCTPESPRNWRGLNKSPSCSMHKQYRQWRNEMTPYM